MANTHEHSDWIRSSLSERALPENRRIVAFGPHVDEAGFTAAQRDGADRVLARSRFFRDIHSALA